MTAITYRKTKTGEWVAYGPAATIQAGTTVTITKRDGTTKREMIATIGKPFTAGGQRMVYGYIDTTVTIAADGGLVATRSNCTTSRGTCDQCHTRPGRHNARDMSGIAGRVCGACYRDGDLSFH